MPGARVSAQSRGSSAVPRPTQAVGVGSGKTSCAKRCAGRPMNGGGRACRGQCLPGLVIKAKGDRKRRFCSALRRPCGGMPSSVMARSTRPSPRRPACRCVLLADPAARRTWASLASAARRPGAVASARHRLGPDALPGRPAHPAARLLRGEARVLVGSHAGVAPLRLRPLAAHCRPAEQVLAQWRPPRVHRPGQEVEGLAYPPSGNDFD
jgi:hypothetical protein